MPRLFVALWPPAELAAPLAEQARATAQAAHGRAMRQETIHLTLAFLGDVAAERLPALQTALAGSTGPGFTLTIDRLGYWPHKHLFWAGCRQMPDELQALVGRLYAALSDAGFAVDRRPEHFTPHLTLVRKAALAQAPVEQPLPALRWLCRSFALVESTRSAVGADYRTLTDYPLQAA